VIGETVVSEKSESRNDQSKALCFLWLSMCCDLKSINHVRILQKLLRIL
jgi:hypothetical protein